MIWSQMTIASPIGFSSTFLSWDHNAAAPRFIGLIGARKCRIRTREILKREIRTRIRRWDLINKRVGLKMKKRPSFLFSWLFAAIAITAQPVAKARPNHPAPPIPMPTPFLTGFGGLLAGVTADQKAAWISGLQQFQVVDGPADGLGPIFNNQSCVACHTQPVVAGAITPGGAGAVLETRFGNLTNGVFNPLTNESGTLLHQMALAPLLKRPFLLMLTWSPREKPPHCLAWA